MSVDSKPLVTVVTVTLNCAHLIEKTIKSVAAQDYPNIEYIVVDGRSSDGTLSLVEGCPVVSELVSEVDNGIYDAMNKGLHAASHDSEYITFLNAGDAFHGKTVVSDLLRLGKADENHIYGNVFRTGRLIESPKKLSRYGLSTDMLCHQAIFFRTAVHRKFLYDVQYRICADYSLLLDMIESGEKFQKTDVIVATLDDGGVSSTFRNELHAERKMIRKKHPKVFVFHYLKSRLIRAKQQLSSST